MFTRRIAFSLRVLGEVQMSPALAGGAQEIEWVIEIRVLQNLSAVDQLSHGENAVLV